MVVNWGIALKGASVAAGSSGQNNDRYGLLDIAPDNNVSLHELMQQSYPKQVT